MKAFLKPNAAVAGLLLAVACAHAAEPGNAQRKELFLNPVIAYTAPAAADAAWNEGCGFSAEIRQYLVDYGPKAYKVVEKEGADFAGLRINLAATSSPESGRATNKQLKWIRLTGQLLDKDNTVVGNFDFHQELNWASLQECKALKSMGYSFGRSLVSWLENPRTLTQVEPKIEFQKDAINEEVSQECKADTYLPQYLMHNGGGYIATAPQPPAGKTHRLFMRMEESRLLGGRWFTGGKWVVVSGRLMDGDQLIGSFKADKASTGYYGLCDTLDYLYQAMADDIVEWLREPTIGAVLPPRESK